MTTPIPPLAPNPAVLDFLATRRSRPARTLGSEGPDRAELARLLALAARCPDHGKLVPWRFAVIDRTAQPRLRALAEARAAALGQDPAQAARTAEPFGQGAAIVAVIACPVPSPKVPEWEQALSAGAVCMGLLTAALAAGWGANWLTGPLARDAEFLAAALGCAGGEWVAGFLHIGREGALPPERDRPDLAAITTWID